MPTISQLFPPPRYPLVFSSIELFLKQAPLMLQWVVKGCLLLRALVLRFLVPPRPECLASRRTPYPSKGTGGCSYQRVLR